MADCYPQGCPPCTEEIKFPENPTNGQRECFVIGKDPNTNEDILKCWVYDHCVPGWRAEGPATAPLQFKGGVDLTKTPAENTIDTTKLEAGDYYVVNNGSAKVGTIEAQKFLDDNWANLEHPVLEGAFILWSGTAWVEIPRPCGEVTQSDWTETDADEPSFILNKPNLPSFSIATQVVVTLSDGAAQAVCLDDRELVITASAEARNKDGDQVFAQYTYKWFRDDTEIANETEPTLTVKNFDIDPDTGSAVFKCEVTAVDVYGNEIVNSASQTVTLAQALQIDTQPADLDLSGGTTSGNITIAVSNISSELGAVTPVYKWLVDGVEITNATTPDVGFTFSNWTTNTLGVELTGGADTNSVRVQCDVSGGCQGELMSNIVNLVGPGSAPAPEAPDNEYGAIGSYTIVNGIISDTKKAPKVGNLVTGQITSGGGADGPTIGLPEGTWRVMGVFFITMTVFGSGGEAKTQLRGTYLLVRVS
jgi:hypothetical protein